MSVLRLNAMVIGVVLALTGGFVIGLLLPGNRKLSARQAEVNSVLQDVKGKQEELGNVGDLYGSIQALDQQMKDYRQKIPADKAFGEFLRDVSGNLKKQGIEDFVVQPRAPLSIDSTNLPHVYQPAAGTVILPVSLQFESSMDKLFGFLASMDELKRISNVESMNLVNDESKPGHIVVEMMLHTYQHP
jgi:Tfp pilus assembly protein PilO